MVDAVVPGHWYLCFACHSCEQSIPVVKCDEKTSITLGGAGTMVVPCPHCGVKHPYRVQELKRVQLQRTH